MVQPQLASGRKMTKVSHEIILPRLMNHNCLSIYNFIAQLNP